MSPKTKGHAARRTDEQIKGLLAELNTQMEKKEPDDYGTYLCGYKIGEPHSHRGRTKYEQFCRGMRPYTPALAIIFLALLFMPLCSVLAHYYGSWVLVLPTPGSRTCAGWLRVPVHCAVDAIRDGFVALIQKFVRDVTTHPIYYHLFSEPWSRALSILANEVYWAVILLSAAGTLLVLHRMVVDANAEKYGLTAIYFFYK